MSAAAVSKRGPFLLGGETDYNHVSDQQYVKYRQLADAAYKKREQLVQQSQKAFKDGNKGEAHNLSQKAKEQLQIAEENNRKAAEYVFIENNKDSDDNDIDLHGLYVKEAEYILKQRIISGIRKNQASLDCIVGKGLHSKNGVAKLKPAVQNLCNDANLKCWIDNKNSGVLHIDIRNARIPQEWYNVDPNGIGAMDDTYYSFHPQEKPQQAYQSQKQLFQNYSQPGQQGYQDYQRYPKQQHYKQSETQNEEIVGAVCCIFAGLLKYFCR